MVKRIIAHGPLLVVAMLVGSIFQPLPLFAVQAQAGCQTFSQTGKQVCGRFLQYWQQNGGLAHQGLPLSNELSEVSDLNGRTYTVQYLERAVFELQPENTPPYDVLLSLLGVLEYKRRYMKAGAPNQRVSTDNPVLFPETGKTLGGRFREYWERNGGLAQQGYPISEEFREVSRVDGQLRMVQYFERAVFELHPENQEPYDVLLAHLGAFRHRYNTYVQKPEDCDVNRMFDRKGLVLAEGHTETPVGTYQMTGYRVEEVLMPGMVHCPSAMFLGRRPFDIYWRVVVTGGPFHGAGAPLQMLVGGTDIGIAARVGPPTQVTTLVGDRSVLQEGSTIGIRYGRQPIEYLPMSLTYK